MHKPRLTTLADGIFAIVMTLLVMDIKVPVEPVGIMSDKNLLIEIMALAPVFMSYVLSFAVLATYWMSHHVVLSIFAKNIDKKLTHLNIPFLMTVALVPFSSRLLGTYPSSRIAVIFYALNIIIIAIFLMLMFRYVLRAKTIKNPSATHPREVRFIYVRILVPLICATLAIMLSAASTVYSIYFLVFAVIFNLIPGGVHFIGDVANEAFGSKEVVRIEKANNVEVKKLKRSRKKTVKTKI